MMRKLWLLILVLAPLAASCADSKDPGQHEMAMKRWTDAQANVLIGLAGDQYKNGNFDKSRATIDEALKLAPQSAAAHVLSAKLYIEAGQLEAAERELAAARQGDPASAEADYLAGVVYQRWQQPERALEFYQHACDLAPAELAYVMAKAEMLVAMDRRKEALALLQGKVTYFEHSGVIRDEVGLLLVQEERYPEAIEMFRRASILSADDLTIREHLAMALFDGQQYGECQQVISALVKNEKYQGRPDLLITLGECQLQTGQAGDAVQNFQKASEAMPDSAGIWLGLARGEMQLGNLRRAEIALQHALQLDEQNSSTHLLLGYLRLRQSRLDEACAAFARASQLDPSDTVSLCMEGLALDRLGRSGEAAAWFQRALKISPQDEMAIRLMARADGHD
jgi:tetratricopeptide (TPR) repeat protein